MKLDSPIWYEPHPVSSERKAELRAQGYRIVDAAFAPTGWAPQNAPSPATDDALTVGRGPRGRWYVKRGREIVTGPFETEVEAETAKAREATL